ncbi:hypothetical protein DP119_02710 [Planococcus maitriensis]|uniref:Uncharacterized protein n=1 Tax=Planococcus maitriensis TaxID=221799 RepID=A0A365KAA6_9BACL|nr:hypothetical protein DP119_02710 [Planococcus maitriensis]
MKTLLEKFIYFLISLFVFLLLFKIVAWIANTHIPLNTQAQLISGIIILPVIAVLSIILSNLLVKSIKESK